MIEDAPDISVQQPSKTPTPATPQYAERLKTNDFQPKPVPREYEPVPPPPEPQPLAQPKEPPQSQRAQQRDLDFNPLTEIPTLSQQHTAKEINELLGIRDASLNDKLKQSKNNADFFEAMNT